MITLRQAVELTLSALEEGVSFDHLDNVTAPMLRAALAESEQQPLSDEQIDALEWPPSGTATVRDIVRLIEAAHGIKGEA